MSTAVNSKDSSISSFEPASGAALPVRSAAGEALTSAPAVGQRQQHVRVVSYNRRPATTRPVQWLGCYDSRLSTAD